MQAEEDPFDELSLVEEALALALKIPHRVEGQAPTIAERSLSRSASKDRHVVELTGTDEEFATLWETNRPRFTKLFKPIEDKEEKYPFPRESVLCDLQAWHGTTGHFQSRNELIDLLIEARDHELAFLESLPDSMIGPTRVVWERVGDDTVEVRFGGLTISIKPERLAWLFAEVASAEGELVSWSELLRRRMERLQRVESASEETIRRYGRKVRAALHPLGDLWKQSAEGVRWTGSKPLKR